MKKILNISFLFFLSVSLCSCPYSSAYYLDETPSIYVEDTLLGNWSTFVKSKRGQRPEPVTVSLSKRTDTEYGITFSGYLDDLKPYMRITGDSITGTAFMSTIGNRQFLNIRINSRTYIAEMRFKDGALSLFPLAENFTSKMIFNSEALRKSVDFHYNTRVHPMLDDDFCLKNMVRFN